MKAISLICALLVLSACDAQQPAEKALPIAATETSAKSAAGESVDPNTVELRISIPKASLPQAMSAINTKTEETARPRLAITDATNIRTMLGQLGLHNGTDSTCFRVCEPECHEVGGGTGTVCHSHCHRECF